MAAGAVGASVILEDTDIVEPLLTCRLDVLGLLSIELDLDGLVPMLGVGFGWAAEREVAPFWAVPEDWPAILSGSFSSRMLPWPDGEGNWVSLNSVEADSRLLWRSSKLTEGKNSKELVVLSPMSLAAPFRPKEKSEWLLDDDAWSIGSLSIRFMGTFSLVLKRNKWSQQAITKTSFSSCYSL